jgi:hypothetical protein
MELLKTWITKKKYVLDMGATSAYAQNKDSRLEACQ